MRQGLVVAGKGSIRRQRDLNGRQRGLRQPRRPLEHADRPRQPQHRGGPKLRVGAPQVEIAGAAGGKVHVAHRGQRRAHEQAEPVPLGLDEDLNRYVGGDFVRRRGGGRQDEDEPEAEADRRQRQGDPPA